MFRLLIAAALATGASIAGAAGLASSPETVTPLLVGAHVPALAVNALDGRKVQLAAAVGGKPTVLVFYRGSWCPFCNQQLSQLNGIQDKLVALGYQIVAVTPDGPADINKTLEKNQLTYTIYSDQDFAAIKAFGVGYAVPAQTLRQYADYGIKLPKSPAESTEALPVPAVFIIDANGVVQFVYVNPDYRIRLSPDLLLAATRASLQVRPLQPKQ